MKSKNVALMAVAIAFGLVAAFITSKMGARTVEVESVQVPVATKVIPVGTMLTEKNLPEYVAFRTVQKDFVPIEAITDPKSLVGKKVSRTLQATNFFMPTDVSTQPDVVLPEGYKEMAIRVTAVQAAAGFVNPGSKVDILGHVYDPKDRSKRIPVRVMKNVLITKVDQRKYQEGPEAAPQLNMVSVAVKDDDAMKLKLFEDTGVSLVLRGDQNKYDDTPTAWDVDLFKFFGINQPAEKTEEPKVADTLKTEKIIIAKKTLKMNEKVTAENFNDCFDYLEIASKLPNETVGNQSDMLNKFLASGLTAGQIVFKELLSDKEVDQAPKTELKTPKVATVDRKRHRVFIQSGTEAVEVVYEEDGKGGWKKVDAAAPVTTDPVQPKEKDKEAPAKPDLNGEKKERVTQR